MMRLTQFLTVCLCGLLICSALCGCESKKEGAATPSGDEPGASVGSEQFTPEDVFQLLTGADDVKLSVVYTEVEKSGTVNISESAVVEKDGDLVKAVLADNDENNVYYYDLDAMLGYEQNDNGTWESVSVEESVPDWQACLDMAFAIEGMNSRIEWLFSSDTYEAYDAKTGRCMMKTDEMVGFFGENWTEMTAYLMQSGDTYYLYMSTADDIGTFTYKLEMEYADVSVTLPK
ncbi:MAG: hypothetical protein IJX76_10165 [Clostridia bacterium]|nr:hypothetical protein [Clostridia bacterium]